MKSALQHTAAAVGVAPVVEYIHVSGQAFVKKRKLGEGAYSTVWLCTAPDGSEVAIKQVGATTPAAVAAFKRECAAMQRAAHNNVVHLVAYDVTLGGMGVAVLELCPGSLVKRMQDLEQGGKRFTLQEVATIAGSVGHAISHVHSLAPPIAHRDLKAENILFSVTGAVKLADFGSSTELAYHCRTAQACALAEDDISRCTTMAYRAPEMADLWQHKRVDQRVDTWAFGVLLYYMLTFEMPFEETKLAIINTPLRLPPRGSLDDTMRAVLEGCLQKDPGQRMPIDTALMLLHNAFPQQVAAPAPDRQLSPVEQALHPISVQPVGSESDGHSAIVHRRQPSDAAVGQAAPAAAAPKAGGALLGMLAWSDGGASSPPPVASPPAPATQHQATPTVQPPPPPAHSPSHASCSPAGGSGGVDLFAAPPRTDNPVLATSSSAAASPSDPVPSNAAPAAPAGSSSGGLDLFASGGWGAAPPPAASSQAPVDLFASSAGGAGDKPNPGPSMDDLFGTGGS